MIAYVTNADYDVVKANQEDFAITFQSKNRPPMRVEVKGGNASVIEKKPKRSSPSFEMVVETDGLGKMNINVVNQGFYPAEIVNALEIEIHSLIEQQVKSVEFDRTCINSDGTITKIEDKENNHAEN